MKIVVSISNYLYKCLQKRIELNVHREIDTIVSKGIPLEQIRTEIEELRSDRFNDRYNYGICDALQVIDKYINKRK